jgi:hypothetical protein
MPWVSRLALLVLPILPSCGGDDEPSRLPDGGADGGDDEGPRGPATVLFRPGEGDAPPPWGQVPFPSDQYRDPDWTLARIPGLDAAIPSNDDILQKGLDALSGFGLTTPIIFFLDRESAPAELALPEGSVLLVDAAGARVPVSTFYDEVGGQILAGPATGTVLHEGEAYVAALTDRAAGLVRDEATAALLSGAAPPHLADLAGAVDLVAAHAGGPEHLLALTRFTTQRVTHELALARDVLEELPPPTPRFDEEGCAPFRSAIFTRTSDPSLDDWLGETGKDAEGRDLPAFTDGVAHDALALVASGAFDAVTFRRPDTRTDGPEDETFEIGPDGRPAPQGTVRIPFTITLPAAAPPTPDGYPVLIVQHGLNGDRSWIFALANTAARAGVATVAIEAVEHGSRADPTDEESSFDGEWRGPDGFGDDAGIAVLDFFEQFTNLLGARDSFRESVLGHAQLARMVVRPDLDLAVLGEALGGEPPKLDGARLYYAGDSLGGILGTLTTAIEPTISMSILNVPGGGIVQRLMPQAPRAAELVALLVQAMFGASPRELYMPWSPAPGLIQTILDAGDPQAYAPHLIADRLEVAGAPLPARSVVLVEVDRDELVSNESTDHIAMAAGVGQLLPALWAVPGLEPLPGPAAGNGPDGTTAALVQVGPAIHGANITSGQDFRYYFPRRADPDDPFEKLPDPIPVPCPVVEIHRMIERLLVTAQTGPPEVYLSLVPVLDFDGDGIADMDDPEPWGAPTESP